MDVSGISHQEILAYCQLYNVRFGAFELDLIRALDRAFLTTRYKQQTKESKK